MDSLLIQNAHFIALSGLLICAAIVDLRSQRIPNRLTFSGIVAALLYYCTFNGIDGIMFSVGGLLAGVGLLLLPYLMGGMGAGDAKLMGSVGAFVGVKGVFIAFLLTAIAGGFYSLFLIFSQKKHFKGFLKNQLISIQLFLLTREIIPNDTPDIQRRPKICYGLAIALGSITYMVLDVTGYSFPI